MSFANIIVCWTIVQEGTNTLIFYIFEYDTEYGAECSAESGSISCQQMSYGLVSRLVDTQSQTSDIFNTNETNYFEQWPLIF